MKLSVPVYLIALLASFVYAVVHYYVPTLPLTQDQVQWIVVTILTLAGVDVVNAIRTSNPGLLAKK
jgi:hypothetical protein